MGMRERGSGEQRGETAAGNSASGFHTHLFTFSEGTDWLGAARLQSLVAQINPKYSSYASVSILTVLVSEQGTEVTPLPPPRRPGARSNQGQVPDEAPGPCFLAASAGGGRSCWVLGPSSAALH